MDQKKLTLFFLFFWFSISLGCWFFLKDLIQWDSSPTYQYEQIAIDLPRRLKAEWQLITEVFPLKNTLWIKVMNKEESEERANERSRTLNEVMKTLARVIFSFDHVPDFYVLEFLDVGGARYTRIWGSMGDVMRFHMGVLPQSEYGKRKILEHTDELTDPFDRGWIDFLLALTREEVKKCFLRRSKFFKVNSIEFQYYPNVKEFSFVVDIKPKKKATKDLILNQVLKLASYNLVNRYGIGGYRRVFVNNKATSSEKTLSYREFRALASQLNKGD